MLQQLFSGNAAQILAFLGLVLPHLSSLVTGSKWLPTWAGGYVTLFFSALIGFFGEWAANPSAYDWRHGASVAASTFFFAVLSYVAVHNKTPIKDALEAKLTSDGTWAVPAYVDAQDLVAPPTAGKHAVQQTSMPQRPRPTPEPAVTVVNNTISNPTDVPAVEPAAATDVQATQ